MAENDVGSLTEAVNALTGEIAGLRAETGELHDYGRRNRTLIWRQWLIIAGLVVLAVWVGSVATDARRTARLARQNTDRSIAQCESANAGRKLNSDLWNYVLSLPPTRVMGPAEQAAYSAQVAQFKAYIAKAFAPQDCTKLSK